MKLGLYGGGFKPFHTGHFAKLLLALDEADKVVSFFGIKKQKFSKKTGKPLKTNFRSFGDKPNARLFNQEMQEEIVSIYEDALENAFPGNLDIVPSADETPITKIFNVLNAFAYQNMSDEERESLGENAPLVSIGQNLQDFNMNNVDEIVVVVGDEELDKTYLSGINRQAEKSELGRKIKELTTSGKIRFETGAGEQERLVDLLKRYRPKATEDHILVRGTHVRDLAGDGNINSLLDYIPSVVPADQRDQIAKILIGDKSQNEAFLMPIVTDSSLLRAAARFTAKKTVSEAVVKKKKGEDHILGLTEDMSMTFDNLKSLISDVLEGRVDHIEEKMDGQNFTFTILDSGELRIFGKGVSSTTLERGGKTRSDIEEAYAKNERVKDAFLSAHDVTQDYLLGKDSSLLRDLFQNGKVVIEGQIMTPINPNTIPYTENHVRFVRPFTPYDDVEIDQEIYNSVFENSDVEIDDRNGRPWSFGPVPKLSQTKQAASDIRSKIEELEREVDDLVSKFPTPPTNVGQYASQVLNDYIANNAPSLDLSGLTEDQMSRAMERLATGNKGAIGKKEIGSAWPEFQKFEKLRSAHVAAAIVDLEKIVQKLGTYFFDTLEFALATNADVVSDLAAEVDKIKTARAADNISVRNVESGEMSDIVDTAWATKLDSSLSRVEQMGLFKKAVEGVVLRMKDPSGQEIVRKLTGMFTPIHRLVSLFKYPDRYSGEMLVVKQSPSKELTDGEVDALNEVLRVFASKLGLSSMLVEGGNAFRPRDSRGRPTGPPVTTDERISRQLSNRITAEIEKNVLQPLGLDYLPAGSTATNKKEIGDVDLVVNQSDLSSLVSGLKGLPYLSKELVPGIPRVLELPGGQAATIMIEMDGKYYQVDLFKSDSIDDTAWELSGGGEGEVKGEYRNLMLSLLAKIKGERESTSDRTVKYTLSFPGGWREKIDKRENHDGRIRDPDQYLPLLGIDILKSDIRNFEGLVDHMVISDRDSFKEALGRFEEYIASRLNSKSEKVRKEAAHAIAHLSQAVETAASEKSELREIKKIIQKIIKESAGDASGFPFVKINWSEKLKMFSSAGWNLYDERASATADGGKDPEGAEKAVAAMENLIYLGQNGYSVAPDSDGGILIQGKGINAKLDPKEAVQYIIGIRTSEDSDEYKLPQVRIRHVAGTKPYDLELASNGQALEVKKMGGRDKLSKLGSATGRLFDRHVAIIRPIRDAGQIAQKFIESGTIISEDGQALIRKISSPPEGLEIEKVATAVELVDYFFNKIRFGRSQKELPGIMIKVEGGQIGAGMIRRIKRGELLDIEDRGNLFDTVKEALNSTLGEYSPGKERASEIDKDSVTVKASTGTVEYQGKVTLDYFYDELIYKLFDSPEDGAQIDESLLAAYGQSIELLAEIYSSLSKINKSQGEDVFDEFIDDLHYGGFYGVDSSYYYSIPCDSSHLDVYGTTQGFRAVLAMKEFPSEGPGIPDVKIKKQAEEREVDLEVDLEKVENQGEEVSVEVEAESDESKDT